MSAVHQLSVKGRRCVGIGGLHVATDLGDEIVTYALGSCLGVTMYDPVRRVGGLVHLMLPDSGTDRAKAQRRPGMFVDTGLPALLDAMTRRGAAPDRLRIAVAGGAAAGRTGLDHFRIGERNIRSFDAWMSAAGLPLAAQELGGENSARTMTIAIATGRVVVHSNGTSRTLVP